MNEEIQKLQKGLTLDEGLPFELIVEKLNKSGIIYEVRWEKKDSRSRYFRSYSITINSRSHIKGNQQYYLSVNEIDNLREVARSKVIEILKYPDFEISGSYSYFSKYKIGKKFDLESLSGILTFSNGRLVERALIYFD